MLIRITELVSAIYEVNDVWTSIVLGLELGYVLFIIVQFLIQFFKFKPEFTHNMMFTQAGIFFTAEIYADIIHGRVTIMRVGGATQIKIYIHGMLFGIIGAILAYSLMGMIASTITRFVLTIGTWECTLPLTIIDDLMPRVKDVLEIIRLPTPMTQSVTSAAAA